MKLNNAIRSIRRDKQMCMSILMISVIIILIVFAQTIAPNSPNEIEISQRFLGASKQYPLGTDEFGRCVLSRLIYGARYSVGISLIVLTLTALISMVLGIAAGYFGGLVDRVFTGICDIFMAFPPLIFVLALIGIFGSGLMNLIVSMVATLWVWYTKVVRNYVLIEKEKKYIVAAKVNGSSNIKIILRHILPNILPPLIVYYTLAMGNIILMISGFSFLGLGVDIGTPEWGAMLSNAKKLIYTKPDFMIYPGICIFFTVCSFNLLGESLRDNMSQES